MAQTEIRSRRRNKRGQGAQLRDDIVHAASTLLEQTGDEDAFTLRAVARAAGITRPAIYAHIADRGEIKLAVVQHTFSALAEALLPVPAERAQPVAALYAVCRVYLDFAVGHPNLYR